jgi:RNA 2',3'-cyclic 3'-phosphodiesterase
LRLFFALWPPRDTADALHAWALEAQRASGGRVTRAETIHLTLAFLGEVGEERLDTVLAAARAVRFEAHGLTLERAGYWAHNRIVWAGPRQEDARTQAIAQPLREEKRPFATHVTLLRKAGKAALPQLEPIRWPVEEFVLVRSKLSARGSDYEVLERFAAA